MPFYDPKDLLVRTAGEPLDLVPAIRRIVRSVDPELPLSDVTTMEEIVAGETAPRRSQLAVVGLFAPIALLLAGIGLHALLAFGVSQRRTEIGIRMALGASRRSVIGMIARESAVLAALGGASGMALAYAAGRLLESLLAGVPPADAATFAVAAGFAVLTALAGALVPAVRALRIDPADAVRAE